MQKNLSQTLPTGCCAPRRRRQRRFTHLALSGLATLAAGWIGSAHAGEHFYNFNPPDGNPLTSGFTMVGSNTNGWQTNGGFTGADGDGFLEITPALGNQNLGILFPLDYFTNADNSLTALPLKGFFMECDVRIGNATGNNGRPADGFSINFASADDPVVYWLGKQGQFRGWGGGDSDAQALEPSTYNFATGSGNLDPAPCDSGTAENGTKTGVSVQFDTWSGNRILDQNGQPAADNVGWRVHYNGKMIERILAQPPSGPLTLSPDGANDLNGLAVCPAPGAPADFTQDASCEQAVCNDTNSIQTGPYYVDDDGQHNGSTSNLCWAHLSVELTTNSPHLLTVIYKGRHLVDGVAITNFSPYVGQLVMGGRTGGANENRDIDNVHIITYPSVQSVFNGVLSSSSFFMNDFSMGLANVGPAKVDQIVSLTLDGVDIKSSPNTTITIGDPNTTIKYVATTPFVSGSAHSVVLTWHDAVGNTQTANKGFTVINYTVMPDSASVPASSIDTTQPGFLITPSQVTAGNPNRMYWTDEQLMGLHGSNHVDVSVYPVDDANRIEWGTGELIDFENAAGSSGQFQVDNNLSSIGIPASDLANANNSAMAVETYLYFPVNGTYVFGGNSDDALRLTFAKNSHDLLGTQVPGLLGGEGGRGIGPLQNIGAVVVTNAPAYYGFRMLWCNGGGGAGLEWYTTSTPGGSTNVLINDVNNNLSSQVVQAYMFSSAAPPYVSYAEPPLDDTQVSPDLTLMYKLTDGSTTVNSGSVALKVNGAAQSPSINNASGVTTISQAPSTPSGLWPVGTNTVELSFKDSAGANYDYNYIFVVGPYATLDPSQAAAVGGQDTTKPGFTFTDAQIDFAAAGDNGDGIPNQVDSANAMIAGLWFPTYGANASSSTGPQVNTTVIDYAISGSAGDFTNDFKLPGIPGTPGNNNNIAALYKFWLLFPKAGFYKMGVSSDDGFRVSEGVNKGPNLLRQILHVSGSGIDKDVGAVASIARDGSPGFGAPLPVNPIVAPVVFLPNNTSCPITTDLTGKIAVAYTGLCGDSDAALVLELQNHGALAAIIINNPNNGFPYTMTGTPITPITIPALNVSGYKGDDSIWTNANLTASIGASQAVELGGADYGKGMGWVDFGVAVPQAGVYPMTLIYENGGGGAGIEFASVQPDGSRILINDTSNPNALLAFQSATITGPTNPTISVSYSGGNIVITYTGTLQSSSTVNGTYAPVSGAASPYTVPVGTTGPVQFYRAH